MSYYYYYYYHRPKLTLKINNYTLLRLEQLNNLQFVQLFSESKNTNFKFLKRNKKILAEKREGTPMLGTGVSISAVCIRGEVFRFPPHLKKEEFIITKLFFGIVEI
jgi:hypothetical protein